MTGRRMPVRLAAVALFPVASACNNPDLADNHSSHATWTTEPEYMISGSVDNDVIFQRPFVQPDPFRNRVLVMDGGTAQISAWTPEGELLFVAGRRGEGPGEFVFPQDLLVERDGFIVLSGDGSRFARFDAFGGHVESFLGPDTRVGYQGFQIDFGFPKQGVHVGIPSLGAHRITGTDGAPAMDRYPLVSVRRRDDRSWSEPVPLLTLDRRNGMYAILFGDERRMYGPQRYGDSDMFRFLPAGAVIARRRGEPGSIELLKIDGSGDTVWHRRHQFEPRRLTSRMIDDHVADAMESLLPGLAERPNAPPPGAFRQAYREALYTPEYLPVARDLLVSAPSNELWLATHEREDSLAVWYAISMGDGDEAPRRVALPERMRVNEANATHVWGIWRDELDVPHVVGRRLVPPPG